jgi:hypothetical protein
MIWALKIHKGGIEYMIWVKPVCPKCGSNLERREEVFWCSNCYGWVAPNDVKFKVRHESCGHWNPKGSHFCISCGEQLEDDYIIKAEQGRFRILASNREEEAQSMNFAMQLIENLKFKRAIKREKGEGIPPLPPPPSERKYKSQFHCKACGCYFWVYEQRLKLPHCQECGAPEPEHVVTVEQ